MIYKKNFIDIFPGIFAFLKSKSKDDEKKNLSTDMWIYLFIAHHFCLTDQKKVHISYQEIESGSLLHSGLGFSRTTIRESIARLEKMKLIQVHKREFINHYNKRMTPYSYTVYLPDHAGTSITKFSDRLDRSESDRSENDMMSENNHSQGSNHASDPSFVPQEGWPTKSANPRHHNIDTKLQSNKYPLLRKDNIVAKTQPPVDKCELAAITLMDALLRKNKIMRRPKLSKWTEDIRAWVKENEVSYTRFSKVLQWYCKHIGEQYVSHAFSASGFCEKFVAIETKMQQEQEVNKQPIRNTGNSWSFEDAQPTQFIDPNADEEGQFREQRLASFHEKL